MTKWTFEQDMFLASYYDAVGDQCGTLDLGKAKGAADRRVKRLKACGAWEALRDRIMADFETMDAYLDCLGKQGRREMLWMCHPASPDIPFNEERLAVAIAQAELEHIGTDRLQ
jgi:hypothetical protein